jgi:hypothetical protein
MHTPEKQKTKKNTSPKQTEIDSSNSTTSGNNISTPKKLLQNDSSRKVRVQKHRCCPVYPACPSFHLRKGPISSQCLQQEMTRDSPLPGTTTKGQI